MPLTTKEIMNDWCNISDTPEANWYSEEELQSELKKQAEEIFQRQLDILECCGSIIYGDTTHISGKYLMEMLVRGIFEGDSELHYDRMGKVMNKIEQKYLKKRQSVSNINCVDISKVEEKKE